MQDCAAGRHAVPIKARDPGRAGWAKQRAWAGVKHGAPEGPTDFMAPAICPNYWVTSEQRIHQLRGHCGLMGPPVLGQRMLGTQR